MTTLRKVDLDIQNGASFSRLKTNCDGAIVPCFNPEIDRDDSVVEQICIPSLIINCTRVPEVHHGHADIGILELGRVTLEHNRGTLRWGKRRPDKDDRVLFSFPRNLLAVQSLGDAVFSWWHEDNFLFSLGLGNGGLESGSGIG